MGSHRRIEGGYLFLVWSLALSTFALVFIAGYAPFFNRSLRVTQFSFERAQALAAAEAGFEDALWELNQNTLDRADLAAALFGATCSAVPAACYVDYDANNQEIDLFNDAMKQYRTWFAPQYGSISGSGWTGCADPPSPCFRRSQTLNAGDGSNATLGSYTVKVLGLGIKTVTDGEGSYYAEDFGPSQPQIISVGSVAGTGRQTTIHAVLERTKPDFRYAAFGHHRVLVQGKVTIDSYDSALGAYGGANAGSNANIGTNAADPAVGIDLQVSLEDGDPVYVPPSRVKGQAMITSAASWQIDGQGTSSSDVTGGSPAGMPTTQMDQKLPAVAIPLSLSSLPITTGVTPGWSGFVGDASGNWSCSGICTCSEPVHIKALYDITGTMNIDGNCQIFIEKLDSPHATQRLNTNASGGKIVKKNGTFTTQIFIKDGGFDLKGGGAIWDNAIALADRKPEKFQIYVTGANSNSAIGQRCYDANTHEGSFFGVVYVENGDLNLWHGDEAGTLYAAEYFGAFASGKQTTIWENVAGNGHFVWVHFDKALLGLALNGTGRPPGDTTYGAARKQWRIKSWKITQQ